jgi:hypothetical protein
MLPSTRPNIAIIPGQPHARRHAPDGDHFNMEGHKVWADNAFAIMNRRRVGRCLG